MLAFVLGCASGDDKDDPTTAVPGLTKTDVDTDIDTDTDADADADIDTDSDADADTDTSDTWWVDTGKRCVGTGICQCSDGRCGVVAQMGDCDRDDDGWICRNVNDSLGACPSTTGGSGHSGTSGSGASGSGLLDPWRGRVISARHTGRRVWRVTPVDDAA